MTAALNGGKPLTAAQIPAIISEAGHVKTHQQKQGQGHATAKAARKEAAIQTLQQILKTSHALQAKYARMEIVLMLLRS